MQPSAARIASVHKRKLGSIIQNVPFSFFLAWRPGSDRSPEGPGDAAVAPGDPPTARRAPRSYAGGDVGQRTARAIGCLDRLGSKHLLVDDYFALAHDPTEIAAWSR